MLRFKKFYVLNFVLFLKIWKFSLFLNVSNLKKLENGEISKKFIDPLKILKILKIIKSAEFIFFKKNRQKWSFSVNPLDTFS